MKLERSNVEFPLWRKKVDKSIFEHNGTIIPAWACQMWNVDTLYADVSSKKDEQNTFQDIGRREFLKVVFFWTDDN